MILFTNISISNYRNDSDNENFHLLQDDFREHYNSIPRKTVLKIENKPSRVVIFNSQARYRTELITLHVNNHNVKVIISNFLNSN